MELGIDVLVDDSPVNMRAAREHGMLAATLIHSWNEELVAGGDPGVVGAEHWPELAEAVDRALALLPAWLGGPAVLAVVVLLGVKTLVDVITTRRALRPR